MKELGNHKAMSRLQAAFEVAAVAGLIFQVVSIVRAWTRLPRSIPAHFGVSGQPDRWGAKEELLWLPILSLLLYLALSWLSRYTHKFNYPWPITPDNAERQYRLARSLVSAIKAEVVWLFAFIAWQASRVAVNRAEGLGEAFVLVVLVVTMGTVITYLALASGDS